MTVPLHVVALRCGYRRIGDALGIGTRRPELSWRVETDERDWRQLAYAVEVVDAASEGEVWTSGVVESDESYLVPWGGPDLESRQRCRWRVQVTGSTGVAAWSEWAEFEIGLLDAGDWSAEFVGPDAIAAADPAQPVAYLRKEFDLPAGFVQARLHVSALGLYEVECNGRRVGDHVLAPGWSSYQHRLRVETFDVTDLVRSRPQRARRDARRRVVRRAVRVPR